MHPDMKKALEEIEQGIRPYITEENLANKSRQADGTWIYSSSHLVSRAEMWYNDFTVVIRQTRPFPWIKRKYELTFPNPGQWTYSCVDSIVAEIREWLE